MLNSLSHGIDEQIIIDIDVFSKINPHLIR